MTVQKDRIGHWFSDIAGSEVIKKGRVTESSEICRKRPDFRLKPNDSCTYCRKVRKILPNARNQYYTLMRTTRMT